MLEETNDNLQEADGKLVNETIESTTENVLIEEAVVAEEVINEVNTTEENVADALVMLKTRIKSSYSH
jgi:enhancing lycopene biosynthesis protein 2